MPYIEKDGQILDVNPAQIILDAIIKAFPDANELGSGITPRYNIKVNELIYYAGGNGDDKKKPNLQKFFTEPELHLLKGQERLNIPVLEVDLLLQHHWHHRY